MSKTSNISRSKMLNNNASRIIIERTSYLVVKHPNKEHHNQYLVLILENMLVMHTLNP